MDKDMEGLLFFFFLNNLKKIQTANNLIITSALHFPALLFLSHTPNTFIWHFLYYEF